jgi:hypothetical protein
MESPDSERDSLFETPDEKESGIAKRIGGIKKATPTS